jgi:phosphoesterase RecJ-like protein
MYRQLTGEGREHLAKISLRSSDNRVDVSVIARSFNGGGHKQAAGATTEKSFDEAVELIRSGIREQLGDRQPTAA